MRDVLPSPCDGGIASATGGGKSTRRDSEWRPRLRQCENSVGTVMWRAMWRVTPPNTISRMREWP